MGGCLSDYKISRLLQGQCHNSSIGNLCENVKQLLYGGPKTGLQIPEVFHHVKTCVDTIREMLVFISWKLYFYLSHSVIVIYEYLCKSKYIYRRTFYFYF